MTLRAFNQKLNVELRRLFQKLSYDGFVYTNESNTANPPRTPTAFSMQA